MGGACACLPYVGENIQHASIFRGECAYLFSYSFLLNIAILGGDNILVACCLPTTDGIALKVV